MPGPGVVGGIPDQSCPYRIQVDVTDELQEIGICVHPEGPVRRVEQRLTRRMTVIAVEEIPGNQVALKPIHLLARNFDNQVQVVRHPAIRVCPGAEFRQEFADDSLQGIPVRRCSEEWPSTVAAERHMMDIALEAQAGWGRSRHGAILARGMGEMQVAKMMIFRGIPH